MEDTIKDADKVRYRTIILATHAGREMGQSEKNTKSIKIFFDSTKRVLNIL